MTESDYFRKIASVYAEINVLNEDIKEQLSEAKEAGFDSALINKTAKAYAAAKLGELREKSEDLIKFIDKVK